MKKIKNLPPSQDALRRWIKDSISMLRNAEAWKLKRSPWSVFQRATPRNFWGKSFYYFLFKEMIERKEFSEREFQEIMERDLSEEFLRFATSKKSPTLRWQRIRWGSPVPSIKTLLFIKKINSVFDNGEKFYLKYEEERGKLLFISRGGKEIWNQKNGFITPPSRKEEVKVKQNFLFSDDEMERLIDPKKKKKRKRGK